MHEVWSLKPWAKVVEKQRSDSRCLTGGVRSVLFSVVLLFRRSSLRSKINLWPSKLGEEPVRRVFTEFTQFTRIDASSFPNCCISARQVITESNNQERPELDFAEDEPHCRPARENKILCSIFAKSQRQI